MERELFSRVLISSVEYKGAGDFLVQHAERVITAQQRLAREGWWTGGKPLYGFARYEFPPNGGPPLKLERGVGTRSAGHHVKVLPDRDDPVRFIALKAMIAWWRQGLGFGAIATRLNKLGVPSPDAGNTRTENGVPHAVSGLWQVNTVKNILLNPRIAGLQDYGRRSEGRLRRTSRSGPRQLASAERKHKGRGKKRRAKLKLNAVEDRIQREAGFEPLIPHEEWLTLVERSRRRGATQEGRRRPKQVQRYAFGTRVFDQTDGCGHPLYGKMRDGKPEYMCGRYMKSRRTECNSNSVDGEQLTRFTLATLREQGPVRKVVRGILALGDYPLPVPLYGEPRVLPAAALDPSLRDRLAAELEAADAGHPGAAAPTIDSGACCRDGHGHAQQVSEVAARRRDDVPVDAADPPAHGDGQESRPTGTVPEGIAPSRAQLRIAAAGLEPATPGL